MPFEVMPIIEKLPTIGTLKVLLVGRVHFLVALQTHAVLEDEMANFTHDVFRCMRNEMRPQVGLVAEGPVAQMAVDVADFIVNGDDVVLEAVLVRQTFFAY